MQLAMPCERAARYNSASQRARVISECWAEENLYCPACPEPRLRRLPANTRASDFDCRNCGACFQLKCASRAFGRSLPDGAYSAMTAAITAGRTPNLLMLAYDLNGWLVRNLTLIPSFAFPLSCVQPRKALSLQARRAGWIGCNIRLQSIPPDARIPLVHEGTAAPPANVRKRYRQLAPIANLTAAQRGWTLDVLNVVRMLEPEKFTLREVLASAAELSRLHPENMHVAAKVRQQLQRLRDMGFLEFVDNKGTYRLRHR